MIDLCSKNSENKLQKDLGLTEPSLIEQYMIRPDEWLFRKIPKRMQTPELVEMAVTQNGCCLRSVSKKLITYDLCQKAVSQDGEALEYVPEQYLSEELCTLAVKSNGKAILYVPEKFITRSLVEEAVCQQVPITCEWDNAPIGYVPYEYIDADLALLSVQHCPRSLKNIYQKFMSKDLLREVLSRDGTALEYVPANKMTYELIEMALKNSLKAWEYIPDIKKTDNFMRKIEEAFPELVLVQTENEANMEDEAAEVSEENQEICEEIPEPVQFSLEPAAVDTITEISSEFKQISRHRAQMLCHFGPEDDKRRVPVYYISDIHLEFQLQPIMREGITVQEIEKFLQSNIQTMVRGIDTYGSILLVAGDTAHSVELFRMFFTCLERFWGGPVFAVLGNHELWDGHPDGVPVGDAGRSLDEIVQDYRNPIPYREQRVAPPIILQNSLFIRYKDQKSRIISEDQLLQAEAEDLRSLCVESTFSVLGGVGFSGLNSHYNAELGLYRDTIQTRQEDREQSCRFLRVYKKLKSCAGDQRIIVLTHTPAVDWLDEQYNPKWIYINGHTHINALIRKDDGTTVLSDNQVGYTPKKWKLSGFTVSGRYDPMQNYEDGIYKISPEMYADFNAGREIQSNGCNYDGEIYALKRNNIYLFLLKGKTSLCLLSGGRRRRLSNEDMQYYYDHMLLYFQKVSDAIMPYHRTIVQIAEEVKKFGGEGTIHGCIVDISFFSHLYLDPIDGKIMAYWAKDMISRFEYATLPELLEAQEPTMLRNYQKVLEKGKIPLLGRFSSGQSDRISDGNVLVSVPRLVLGTEMYDPSRIMRAIQYIYDQNVIRIWNDEILYADFRVNNMGNTRLLPK